jgi:hypothetical protein
MPQASFVPPSAAVWLVDLFACDEIQGDLIEEHSEVASRRGPAYARRWYWRQCLRTIARLVGDAYCHAPWAIAGCVVGAILAGIVTFWLEVVLVARFVLPVLLQYSFTHFGLSLTNIFLTTYQVLTVSLIAPALMGWVAAKAGRERGMVAALTLTLLFTGIMAWSFPWRSMMHPHQYPHDSMNNPVVFCIMLATMFVSPVMIPAGGAIGRKSRQRRA